MDARSEVWIEVQGKVILNNKMARLLKAIDESGSLRRAVDTCGLSYRNAWGLLREMEAASGIKFVHMRVGGRGGTHCFLTQQGKEWLSRYLTFQRNVENFIRDEFDKTFKCLRLATTSCSVSSGLLTALLPPFEKRFNIKVDVFPVGTRKALELASLGQVDAILVHTRKLEEHSVPLDYGVNRRDILYRQFVLVGPTQDPAQVRQARTAVEAFKRIADKQVPFLSRGDNSGTYLKEKEIWALAHINPQGDWYIKTGKQLSEILELAQERRAYLLAERNKFLALKELSDLDLLFEGDPILYNLYSIMAIDPVKHPQVNYVMAMTLIGWLTSQEQKTIQQFKNEGSRQFLFHPVLLSEVKS
ncbi:MAG TPA: substrate-binding domain-containing protein [Candidatus Limnocylindrales bacterium]|nr:substrate-binding domain-containing protein [Candidatus Limnocylindrales bacterium]